jgi:hypothetical protein
MMNVEEETNETAASVMSRNGNDRRRRVEYRTRQKTFLNVGKVMVRRHGKIIKEILNPPSNYRGSTLIADYLEGKSNG